MAQVMRSDTAGPWDSGHMQFVILLDIQVGNGQLAIQNGSSGERSRIGDTNTGVIYMSVVFRAMNLDEIIKGAREENCGDSPGMCQYFRFAT